jgi:biopolymer transport protein ExbD
LWNGEAAPLDQLQPRFAAAEAKQPPPELHIRADRHAHCEKVAQLMALAAKASLARIAFVRDPASQ